MNTATLETVENKIKYPSSKKLWDEYLESDKKDIKIRNKIVLNNRKLAQSEAHRSHRMALNYTTYEDLEQQAIIALIWAIEKFNPDKGYQFSTFAVPVIRGRLMNYIRDKASIVKVPRKMIDKISEIRKKDKIDNLEINDKKEFKKLESNILNCRYYKPLEHDNLIKDVDDESNGLIDTKFCIPSVNNQYLSQILKKKNPTPFDILNFRKMCRVTQIKTDIQLD